MTGLRDDPTRMAVTDQFLAFELEQKLFDLSVRGVDIWERVRFSVYRGLLEDLGLAGQAHTGTSATPLRALRQLLAGTVVRSPFLAPEASTLVYGHQRRKQLDDGYWWDIYCDPVVDQLLDDVVAIEELHEGRHLTPAKTSGLRYLDTIEQLPNLALAFSGGAAFLSDTEREQLATVEAAFEARFGISTDLESLVGRRLLKRRIQLPLFERVLRRVDPEVVLLVVSYDRETFVEACQRQGVPTVELQHGVVSHQHLGYAYPGERTKRTFPDYLLTFGEFWTDTVSFPLGEDRIYPVGYPYLESRLSEYDTRSDDSVVFISQGTIGAGLSRFALEVAERRPDLDIVYKLHPGEYGRWMDDYPWLVDAPFTVVGADGPELYDLFADAATQVGVYSTALYEGLCFDLDTYVVDLPGNSYMDALVARGAATRVSSPAELLDDMSNENSVHVDTDEFFRPNALSNIEAALSEIRRRER